MTAPGHGRSWCSLCGWNANPPCPACPHYSTGRSQRDAALALAEPWMHQCGSCDAGLPMNCTCPEGDPRHVIAALAEALRLTENEQAPR